jgi:hypothetical protein
MKNHQKKESTISAQFKTLLHELITGKRRMYGIVAEVFRKEYEF